jgi:plasmid stability protein
MATLTIRNLPDDVRDRLRVRAAKAGVSMEAEVRSILARASAEVSPAFTAEDLQRWIDRLYGDDRPTSAVDALGDERRHEAAREIKSRR